MIAWFGEDLTPPDLEERKRLAFYAVVEPLEKKARAKRDRAMRSVEAARMRVHERERAVELTYAEAIKSAEAKARSAMWRVT